MRTSATGKNASHPLALWRKKRNFNQMDASFELNVSISSISTIEKGYPVTIEVLEKIFATTKEEFTLEMYKKALIYRVGYRSKKTFYAVL